MGLLCVELRYNHEASKHASADAGQEDDLGDLLDYAGDMWERHIAGFNTLMGWLDLPLPS